MSKKSPWYGWKPGSGRKYDPANPHFDPMHPPEGYPKELLEAEWGEKADEKPDKKPSRDTDLPV